MYSESAEASQTDVAVAGCQLMALLYGGSVEDNLNKLRQSTYMNFNATKQHVQRPERLPPTEDAARYHVNFS